MHISSFVSHYCHLGSLSQPAGVTGSWGVLFVYLFLALYSLFSHCNILYYCSQYLLPFPVICGAFPCGTLDFLIPLVPGLIMWLAGSWNASETDECLFWGDSFKSYLMVWPLPHSFWHISGMPRVGSTPFDLPWSRKVMEQSCSQPMMDVVLL